MVWVNSFSDDDLPAATINYEFLAADSASVALSVIQGAYITRRYLLGGHEAEYQFKIIARIKPGGSNDKRLKADAVLNRFGDWAMQNYPSLEMAFVSVAWKRSAARRYSPCIRADGKTIKF